MRLKGINKGVVCIILAALIWSSGPVAIKYLSYSFDLYTQNFYRYLFASSFLIIGGRIFYRRQFHQQGWSCKGFLLPSLIVVSFQVCWVAGIYRAMPTVALLISKLSAVFIIFFSLPFKDERAVIRSPLFIYGLPLAFAGTAGVILGGSKVGKLTFNAGVPFMLAAAALWALFLVSVKWLVAEVNPQVSVTYVYALATLWLFFIAAKFGQLEQLANVSLVEKLVLVASGICNVGLANALNFVAIKHLGATVANNVTLTTPALTGLFSFLLFHETFTFYQLIGAIGLLLGCGLVLQAKLVLARLEPS